MPDTCLLFLIGNGARPATECYRYADRVDSGRDVEARNGAHGTRQHLLLYTDGLTEAANSMDQEFGIPRLKELFIIIDDSGR